METFHMIVLAIAAAVLILILTSVGVMMRDSNRDTAWPPTQSSCPDGWEEDLDPTKKGTCYIPSGMRNSGKVVMSATPADNLTNGYAFQPDGKIWMSGDKWHLCGTATYVSDDKKTLTADLKDPKSNFNYFNAGDSIRLDGKFGAETTVEKKVVSKTEKSLTLDTALSNAPNSPIQYYGIRMSVNFKQPAYDGICQKKNWAKLNSVEWDGVSNYNKCPAA